MIFKSPAKLNLYLEVLSKRSDNFHNIKTVFEKVALCDLITFKKKKEGIRIISSSGEKIPLGPKNLAYKTALLLQKETGIKKGIEISIKKNIPVGAGLGGGSSNAATVLLGLNRLWRLGLGHKKLAELGSKIGADVPFFLNNYTWALGLDKGNRLKKLNSSLKLWHLVIVPRARIPTKESYQGLSLSLTREAVLYKMILSALRRNNFNLLQKALFNRLEESPIAAKCLPIWKIKDILANLGLKSIMSGSGSAVFALFLKQKEALKAQKILSSYPGKVFVVKTW